MTGKIGFGLKLAVLCAWKSQVTTIQMRDLSHRIEQLLSFNLVKKTRPGKPGNNF